VKSPHHEGPHEVVRCLDDLDTRPTDSPPVNSRSFVDWWPSRHTQGRPFYFGNNYNTHKRAYYFSD